LNDVHDPVGLLENEVVRDAVASIKQEEDSVYKSKPIVETFANHVLVRIKTSKPQVRLCGLIGAKLMGVDNNMTYVVLNETSGEVSIRGILAKYIANKLNKAGFKAGGHPGFVGASVEGSRIEEFMEVIREI
jgi:phosphoglycerate-specific signal transduction histidine kinase